jgi:SAM-dependent methyltransferase
MILNKDRFDQLINDAWHHEFSGWDFAYLSKRMLESSLSWDYRQRVLEKIKTSNSLLDMDTGGGEYLSSLRPLPEHTCATEGYSPNIPVARACLEPIGVQVFDTSAGERLPFEDKSFDLVINRHGEYKAAEIQRILKPGKCFITQQVGGKNDIGLNEQLQERAEFPYTFWTLDYAIQQLVENGLRIVECCEEFPATEFTDIGAVVYYLKVISWQVSDFTIEKYYEKLGNIHNIIEETGKFIVASHRFYIEAKKE